MKRQSSEGGSFVDHKIRYRISQWSKSARKRDFRTGFAEGRIDGRRDGRTGLLIEMHS